MASEPQDLEGTPALRPAPTLSKPLTLPKQPDWKIRPCCPPAPVTQSQNTSTNSGKRPNENNEDVCFLIPTATELLPSTFFSQRALGLTAPCPLRRTTCQPPPKPVGGECLSFGQRPEWMAMQRLPGVLERKGGLLCSLGPRERGCHPRDGRAVTRSLSACRLGSGHASPRLSLPRACPHAQSQLPSCLTRWRFTFFCFMKKIQSSLIPMT